MRLLPLLAGFAVTVLAAQEPPVPPAAAPAPIVRPAPQCLDKGLLDPSWFGEGVNLAKGQGMDFLWIKPGLDLTGRTIHMRPWEDPAMRRKGRSGKDNAKATELTDAFPGILRGAMAGALGDKAKVSRTEGDLALVGRLVDANAGSKGAKWFIGCGAGCESATWDLKLTDAKTGELLMAVHHRALSGTLMTSIQDKVGKWAETFAKVLAEQAK